MNTKTTLWSFSLLNNLKLGGNIFSTTEGGSFITRRPNVLFLLGTSVRWNFTQMVGSLETFSPKRSCSPMLTWLFTVHKGKNSDHGGVGEAFMEDYQSALKWEAVYFQTSTKDAIGCWKVYFAFEDLLNSTHLPLEKQRQGIHVHQPSWCHGHGW